MKLTVVDNKGKSTGNDIQLPKEIFDVEPNEHVVYLAVKSYLAAQRQGTSSSKERNQITGSTKKIRKQKGTGMARAGDIKNPLFRGGGTIFGPKPRTYTLKLNKKERLLARASVLSEKAKNNAISVVSDLTFETPKTKVFQAMLQAVKANGKVLFVHDGDDKNENVIKSARNLSNVKTANVGELNTYQVLHADSIVFSESAIKKIVE